jgi:integrase
MARPKATEAPDLSESQDLTAGLIERLTCPTGKQQAFMRDTKAPGLRVRVTAAGAKSFVFEAKLNRQTIRRTIGDVRAWTIEAARVEANRLRVTLDAGTDPRELERQQQEAASASKAAATAQAVTVGDIWPRYLQEGKPKRRDAWKPGYRASLDVMAAPGGVKKIRGQGLTRPGPLFPLMALALGDVTEDALQLWFEREALAGKHQAARALMMFRGFLRWCAARPEYRKLIDRDAGRAPAILENLPSNTRRTDALAAAQLQSWWQGVEQLSNRTASVYLRALLLTGARKEELAALAWDKVDFRWRKMTIADKVRQTRTIPMTPYLAQLLATLPRKNEFVFAGTGATGHITDTRKPLKSVLVAAEIDHVTIHGIRRTFTQRGRAVVPAGAVAQIQGHAPSATAEGYNILTLDDLRPYAEQIEASILHSAGVSFDRTAEPGKLRVVNG